MFGREPVAELGELLELLHGARQRYETVRLTARSWRDLERSRRAHERWAAEQQGSWTVRLYAVASGVADRPATTELRTRLWLAPPDLAREETEGEHEKVAVRRGQTWWLYTPDLGAISNEGDPNHGTSLGQESVRPLGVRFDVVRAANEMLRLIYDYTVRNGYIVAVWSTNARRPWTDGSPIAVVSPSAERVEPPLYWPNVRYVRDFDAFAEAVDERRRRRHLRSV